MVAGKFGEHEDFVWCQRLTEQVAFLDSALFHDGPFWVSVCTHVSGLCQLCFALLLMSSLQKPTALDDLATKKLASFLVCFTEPLYFESVPIAQRKLGATTASYVLATAITEEQHQLLRFKGGFASNEEILCAAWLETHGSNDYFFCVTNCGVYSVRPSSPLVFISHNDLRNLSVVEEYKESRYIGIRLSNGQGIIVSIQNAYMRPYANKLFTGLINILNGDEPVSRITEKCIGNDSVNTDHSLPVPSFQLESVKQKKLIQHSPSIPFRNSGSDKFFDLIIQINSIDNVGDFIESILSNSDNANSRTRKRFQSYVARSIISFRREIVENGGFRQFKNDIATMEACGAAMAFAFIQMQERGVSEDLATRILFEGIRATFNLDTSAQRDPIGIALIRVVESYISDEEEDLGKLFFNIVFRLVGSNLSGKLYPDYSEFLEDHISLLQDFALTMDPNFTTFVKKMISESCLLVDGILNTRW